MENGFIITKEMMLTALEERFGFDDKRVKSLKGNKRFEGKHADAVLVYATEVRSSKFERA